MSEHNTNPLTSLGRANVDTRAIDVDWQNMGHHGSWGIVPCDTLTGYPPTAEEIEDFGLEWGEREGEPAEEIQQRWAEYLDEDNRELCADLNQARWESSAFDGPTEQSAEPMMNYAWPVACEADESTARAVYDCGAVALVTIDGEPHIALTGGGMDLSWGIARAYVAASQLPPAVLDLPIMAGNVGDELTAAAWLMSRKVAAEWASARAGRAWEQLERMELLGGFLRWTQK